MKVELHNYKKPQTTSAPLINAARSVLSYMKRFSVALLAISMILSVQGEEAPQEWQKWALPVLRNWLHQKSEVVEVCIFREEWKEPTEQLPKGRLFEYATITRVHKGSMKVGDRVVLRAYIEYARSEWKREAGLRPSRISLVDGELRVVIFDRKDTPQTNGYWDVGADISRFSFDEEFYQAFQFEQKRDPSLVGAPH
ncbi:MAG TPA: hypothetical protein VF585_09225 [Chthoniobacterales bacterium]